MALGTDTARLQTVLTLKDGLSPGLNKPIGTVGKFNKGMDSAGKKVGAFTGKLKTAGAVAGGALAGGLFIGIKSGLQNLGELESATTSVDAALRQMGKSGKVTAAQIADWANEIEAATDAAFDDKAITAATTTLLRFGKVTTKNIRPAMEVMTDLAAKTGDVDSAASLLAKALADPTKAAGKLARQGIILTEAQEKQIKAFMKAGDEGAAQAVVLEAIEKSTKGAAAAMNGPYVDAQRKLDDAVEDGTKALAVGFLPLITEVSEELRKGVADPGTMDNIRNFGKGLAGAFKEALAFAKKVPWGAIADGLKTSAQWAGRLFDAFRSLPPEVQGTIVALAGLSKLTGGAPIKIAVDFAKDALGSVFGRFFDRGSSAANPLWVTGKGFGSGPDGGKDNLFTGIKDLVKFGVIAAVPIAVATAGAALTKQIGDGIATWVADGNKNLEGFLKNGFDGISRALNPIGNVLINLDSTIDSLTHLDRIPGEIGRIVDFITGNNKPGPLPGAGTGTNLGGGRGLTTPPVTPAIISQGTKPTKDAVGTMQGRLDSSIQATRAALHSKLEGVRAAEQASIAAYRTGERSTGAKVDAAKNAINATKATVTARSQIETARLNAIREKQQQATNAYRAGERATGAKISGVSSRLNTANARLAQIRAKRSSFTTNVTVNTSVAVRTYQQQAYTYAQNRSSTNTQGP
jgi:hypothetical protein